MLWERRQRFLCWVYLSILFQQLFPLLLYPGYGCTSISCTLNFFVDHYQVRVLCLYSMVNPDSVVPKYLCFIILKYFFRGVVTPSFLARDVLFFADLPIQCFSYCIMPSSLVLTLANAGHPLMIRLMVFVSCSHLQHIENTVVHLFCFVSCP